MRFLQIILLVIGATALGAVSCALSVFYLVALISRPRPGQEPGLNWGPLIILGPGLLCAGTVGALAGLVTAICWINRHNYEPWRPMAWIGVALGLAVGWAIRFFGAIDRTNLVGEFIELWPGTAILIVVSGTLGGFVGNIAGALWQRKGTRSSR